MSLYRFCAACILAVLLVPALAEQAQSCDSIAACRGLEPEVAGPVLLRLLQDQNWDTRVEAAFALANIGYAPAVPELIKALSNESDWQLAYAAAIALSRMKDRSALEPLQETAASYWYPPVRGAADCAARLIESGKNCARHEQILDIDATRLRAIRSKEMECGKRAYPKVSEPAGMKQYGDEDAMERFKYTGTECEWYGEVDKATGNRPCLGRHILYPKLAARAADGWFTGRDQGEFGGDVMFFPESGKPYEVLAESVEDIYVLDKGVVALARYEDDVTSKGMVYSLRKDGSGKWQGAPLLRLPAAPEASYKISKKQIIVDSYGVMVIFDDQGNPKMADCEHKK